MRRAILFGLAVAEVGLADVGLAGRVSGAESTACQRAHTGERTCTRTRCTRHKLVVGQGPRITYQTCSASKLPLTIVVYRTRLLIAAAGEHALCGHEWPILRKRGRGCAVATLGFTFAEGSKLLLTPRGIDPRHTPSPRGGTCRLFSPSVAYITGAAYSATGTRVMGGHEPGSSLRVRKRLRLSIIVSG